MLEIISHFIFCYVTTKYQINNSRTAQQKKRMSSLSPSLSHGIEIIFFYVVHINMRIMYRAIMLMILLLRLQFLFVGANFPRRNNTQL
jgi:hypothetical protein